MLDYQVFYKCWHLAAMVGTVRAMRAGWLGKGWEVCSPQGKMKEPRIEKLVSLGIVISQRHSGKDLEGRK